ncbi:MAG: RHS repeat-associated core domain-containing protein [Steroidobacteraceae bacterium]
MLGEYTSTGAMIEEMVWLGDIPIATARPTAQQWIYSINYIHTDQLNAPRQITRAADNVQMWTWFSDPFGTSAANSNPAGAGLFINNLRFPGQIYDPQAGLLQNGMRDYDPLIGRYIESDPIGLAGGSYATYEYCNANPLARTDPSGEAFVNCAKALAELEKAEAKVAGRLAEMADTVACGRRVDSGHIQSLGESVNRLKNAIDNVNKHCGKYTGAAAALAAAAATLAEAVALLFVAVAA